jgi:hypothetical protein
VHRYSREIVTDDLALPGVQTATDLEAERLNSLPDCAGTANRAGGAVEGRQETIAGGVDLAPAMLLQYLADFAMERPEQFAPRTIAKFRNALGRAHDIGKQHGRQHPLVFVRVEPAGQELFDVIENHFAAVEPISVVDTGKLD